MGEVVDFKSKLELLDEEIEKIIRGELQKKGYSDTAIENALTLLMPMLQESRKIIGRNLNCQFPKDLTPEQSSEIVQSFSVELQKFQREVHELVLKHIVQMAFLVADYSEGEVNKPV